MSRTGMAVGRVVGANGVMVIADLLGFRVPLEANPNHEGGLTLGSAFQGRADHSGATVPDSHRLPRLVSTRPTIKSAISRVNTVATLPFPNPSVEIVRRDAALKTLCIPASP